VSLCEKVGIGVFSTNQLGWKEADGEPGREGPDIGGEQDQTPRAKGKMNDITGQISEKSASDLRRCEPPKWRKGVNEKPTVQRGQVAETLWRSFGKPNRRNAQTKPRPKQGKNRKTQSEKKSRSTPTDASGYQEKDKYQWLDSRHPPESLTKPCVNQGKITKVRMICGSVKGLRAVGETSWEGVIE